MLVQRRLVSTNEVHFLEGPSKSGTQKKGGYLTFPAMGGEVKEEDGGK